MPILLSHFLDACRWIGAIIVLGVHSTNFFVNLADIMSAPHAATVYGWWFFVNFELGHQGVVGFFVMSGYLVGGAVLSGVKSRKDFLREYLVHRFARIYMVTAPAVALTFLFDSFGRLSFGTSGVYGLPVFEAHSNPLLIVSNLLNLQNIYFEHYGTNGPLWSLACEFWYYVTFPLLLLPFARQYSRLARFGGFAAGLTIFIVLALPSSWFLFGYSLWALGAAASLATRPLIRSRWLAAALLAASLVAIRLLVRGPVLLDHPWLQTASDLTTAILFLNLATTLRFGPTEGWRLFAPTWHKTLADFSFSLYCVHMPTLVLVRAATDSLLGAGWAGQLATPAHWTLLAATMSLTIVLAYGFSRLTEAKNSRRAQAVARRFGAFRPARARRRRRAHRHWRKRNSPSRNEPRWRAQRDQFLRHRRMQRHCRVEIAFLRAHFDGDGDDLRHLSGIRPQYMHPEHPVARGVHDDLHVDFFGPARERRPHRTKRGFENFQRCKIRGGFFLVQPHRANFRRRKDGARHGVVTDLNRFAAEHVIRESVSLANGDRRQIDAIGDVSHRVNGSNVGARGRIHDDCAIVACENAGGVQPQIGCRRMAAQSGKNKVGLRRLSIRERHRITARRTLRFLSETTRREGRRPLPKAPRPVSTASQRRSRAAASFRENTFRPARRAARICWRIQPRYSRRLKQSADAAGPEDRKSHWTRSPVRCPECRLAHSAPRPTAMRIVRAETCRPPARRTALGPSSSALLRYISTCAFIRVCTYSPSSRVISFSLAATRLGQSKVTAGTLQPKPRASSNSSRKRLAST